MHALLDDPRPAVSALDDGGDASARSVGRRRSPWRALGGWPDCMEVQATRAPELLDLAAWHMAGGLPRVAADFAHRLRARQERRSTALGCGVALPHAESGYANRLHALYLRSSQPLVFDAPDGEGVTDFMVLMVPRPASPAHGALLSRLTQLLTSPGQLAALRRGPLSDAVDAMWRRARAD